MGDSDKSKSPFSVDVGLKASLEVKTEIPKETTGRLIAALTDIIRPFTEARGLRGDQLRLQREDVLLEITKKARARADLEMIELHPVPNKMLVPFLEKASLESEDTEMQERWAALLLSASTSYHAQQLTFVDILSRLSSEELLMLEEVCLKDKDFPHLSYYSSPDKSNDKQARKHAHMLMVREYPDMDCEHAKVVFDEYERLTSLAYGKFMTGEVAYEKNKTLYPIPLLMAPEFRSLELLVRERLVDVQWLELSLPTGFGAPTLVVRYFYATSLGVSFVRDCAPRAKEIIARYENR